MAMVDAIIKNIDHLGLMTALIDELKIAESVNEALPYSSPCRHICIDEVVKAMIINGLGYVNKRLFLIPFFSRIRLNTTKPPFYLTLCPHSAVTVKY